MKVKDVIISTVVAAVAVIMTVGAGIIIKGQIYKNAIKSAICKYDKTLQNESADKIIVGMLACPKQDEVVPSIIAIPPTADEAQAYLSVCAYFENINPADGRGLKDFVPVYATGKISKNKIYSSNNSDIKDAKNLGTFEFAFWNKEHTQGIKENITIKSSRKTDVLGEFNKNINTQPYIGLNGLVENDISKDNNKFIQHSITQPTNIYEIYGETDLGKINKDAYNPVERMKLSDSK